jgi:hypothetical protein
MADNDNLNLSVTCAICLDVASADNAVETTCCHHLFCLPCIENVKPCPTCRTANFGTVPAYFARRLIGSMIVPCPNADCTAKISRSDLANHLAVHCTFKQLTCPDPQCNGYKCTKKSFLEHLTNKHEQFLLDNFEKLWQKQEVVGSMTIIRSDENRRGKMLLMLYFFVAFKMIVLFF